MTSAHGALEAFQRLSSAYDRQDWVSFGECWHPDAIYEFVSQPVVRGREAIVAFERQNGVPGTHLTRDLFTADETGRMWWRYDATWTDPETGVDVHTSGATTAVVTEGLVVSMTSWIDLSFLLPAPH